MPCRPIQGVLHQPLLPTPNADTKSVFFTPRLALEDRVCRGEVRRFLDQRTYAWCTAAASQVEVPVSAASTVLCYPTTLSRLRCSLSAFAASFERLKSVGR